MFTEPPASASAETSSRERHLARIRALLSRGEYVVDLDRLAMAIVGAHIRRSAS